MIIEIAALADRRSSAVPRLLLPPSELSTLESLTVWTLGWTVDNQRHMNHPWTIVVRSTHTDTNQQRPQSPFGASTTPLHPGIP